MTFGLYEVVGTREYRGHKPGEQFEALLAHRAAARAIERGDIRLLREVTPELQAGSYEFPPGWLDGPFIQTTEAPKGASLIREEQ